MNVAAFIAEFRRQSDDVVVPPASSDAAVLGFLNEALDEACERARLIEDRTTAACCSIELLEAEGNYPLHASVLWVKRVTWRGRALAETSIEELDANDSAWESRTGQPVAYVQYEGSLRLVPKPNATVAGEEIDLTVYRRELTPRTLAGSANTAPEVAERFHLRLVDWMLYRHYSVPDAEQVNKVKASEFEGRFTVSFGERIDANVQRKHRDRRPPVVRMNPGW